MIRKTNRKTSEKPLLRPLQRPIQRPISSLTESPVTVYRPEKGRPGCSILGLVFPGFNDILWLLDRALLLFQAWAWHYQRTNSGELDYDYKHNLPQRPSNCGRYSFAGDSTVRVVPGHGGLFCGRRVPLE